MEAERRAAQKAARKRRVITALVVVVLVLGLMALISVLGGDDGGEEDAAPATTTTTAPDKPDVTIPETPPPTELQTTDLTVGEGAEATPGSAVQVHYAGRAYSNGQEFDSSYERPEAFTFTIGEGSVIPGWEQGVAGMREGGRRQLVVPPDLAYGEEGRPPEIGPNDTLVFVIDLLKVEEPPEPLPPPAPPATPPVPTQPGG